MPHCRLVPDIRLGLSGALKAGNQLVDAKDKRNINADAKLEKIFGKKQASMFEMNKYLSAHLKTIKA